MESGKVREIFMKRFGENLKDLREKKYNTFDNVAINSAFDSSNYNKYELGKGNPTIETILKIASLLEIEPKELFNFYFDIKNNKIDM